ncbi:MAG TPA: hypothetical protein VG889_20275, partial [Rhizomicrobium sp.]|nr:hypothetical protein [Rhizomicrobium sp.]
SPSSASSAQTSCIEDAWTDSSNPNAKPRKTLYNWLSNGTEIKPDSRGLAPAIQIPSEKGRFSGQPCLKAAMTK